MAKLTGAAKRKFLARMKKGRDAKSRKNKSKSVKKSRSKTTKSVKVKRKSSTRKPMARRKSSTRRSRARGKIGGILNNPTLKKVMIGMGAASLTGTVVGMVAPQFVPIAKPLSALAVGGPIGAVAAVLADGGLGAIGGIFGQPQQTQGGI